MDKQLLKATQGSCVRFIKSNVEEKSNAQITGLCTDNMRCCVCIVIANAERISLSHIDGQTDLDSLNSEIEWVNGSQNSNIEKILLISNPNYNVGSETESNAAVIKAFKDKFQSRFKIEEQKAEYGFCAIPTSTFNHDSEYEKKLVKNQIMQKVEEDGIKGRVFTFKQGSYLSSEEEKLRHTINIFNGLCSILGEKRSMPLDIQWINDRVTPLPKLNNNFKEILDASNANKRKRAIKSLAERIFNAQSQADNKTYENKLKYNLVEKLTELTEFLININYQNKIQFKEALLEEKESLHKCSTSNSEKASLNLADIYRLQGRYEEAWQHYYNILERNTTQIDAEIGRFLCEQHIAPKAVFVSVDLKLTSNNEIKILEFGPGIQSAFVGLTVATDQKVEELLHAQFKQLQLPTLYLNNIPGNILAQVTPVKMIEQKIAETKISDVISAPRLMSQYSRTYSGAGLKSQAKDILLLDDSILNMIAENKDFTHEIFEQTKLLNLRPKTVKFLRRYDADLVQQIKNNFPSAKMLILKAPDFEKGQGVVVVKYEDLDITLGYLLSSRDTDFKRIKLDDKFEKYYQRKQVPIEKIHAEMDQLLNWRNSNSLYFLVEEYVYNKPIMYLESIFDAVMRVAVLLIRDDEKFRCVPFACYWKLPPKPVNFKGNLRDKTITSFSSQRHEAVAVTGDDQQVVYQQLEQYLPRVMSAMITKNMFEHIEKQSKYTENEVEYKAILWSKLANTLTNFSHYLLAQDCLEKAKKLTPNHFRAYHEFGVFYHAQGCYDKALEYYNDAITKDQNQPATYWRRAITWDILGKQAKAQNDFIKAVKLNRSYLLKVPINYRDGLQSSIPASTYKPG